MVQPAKACLSLVAAAVLDAAAGAIQAQNYPTKPVKILERPDVKASFIRQGAYRLHNCAVCRHAEDRYFVRQTRARRRVDGLK